MSRQDANAAFAQTSFLYGGNASYIEDLQARFENDPNAIDAEWREFFQSLKDNSGRCRARMLPGLSWQPPILPHDDGELIAALTGDWSASRRRSATRSRPRRSRAARKFHPPTSCRPRAIRSTC